jgi:hypothetical protein
MPTIANTQVPVVLEGLGELAQLKIPVAGALRIRKVTRALQEHWRDVLDVRQQLAKQYCQLDDDGELVVERQPDGTETSPFRDGEAGTEFTRAWQELMSVEFEHPYGVEVAHLGRIEVTAATLLKLDTFLIEDDDAALPAPPA